MLFLLLMFSFAQVGFLGIGSSVGSQAFLEHEVITLHRWLTPSQMADLMVFCRALPGGTGINTATLTGFLAASARFGFWGSVVASVLSVVSLALPSALWTAFIHPFPSAQGVRFVVRLCPRCAASACARTYSRRRPTDDAPRHIQQSANQCLGFLG